MSEYRNISLSWFDIGVLILGFYIAGVCLIDRWIQYDTEQRERDRATQLIGPCEVEAKE